VSEKDPITTSDETIRPIDPGLRRSTESDVEVSSRRASSRAITNAAIAAALVFSAIIVFFALPRFVPDPSLEREESVSAVDEAVEEPDRPRPMTREELEALRNRSQTALARLLSQKERIEARAVEIWGGEAWESYVALVDAGDDAYLRDDFSTALESYEEGYELGFSLLDQASSIVATSLEDGHAAIEAEDPDRALEQFDTVLAIEPSNGDALFGRRRAERLQEVLDLVDRAEALEEMGDLVGAADAYRQALAIDAIWNPAIVAFERVEAEIERRRFERLLSSGYTALADGEFTDAIEHFNAVLSMRPGTTEALEGIAQAEEGIELGRISLARVRAAAFERRELWDQAMAQYEAALDTDPTLQYAIEGLERSRLRFDLDAKLVNLIENATLLFDDSVIEQARALLDDAASVAQSGPRLEEQVDRLSRLIELATTPLSVTLESDAQTLVTLYRVGELGAFTSLELDLKPGNYTAVGIRRGYRDVRRTFTVLPGQKLEPISVICVEPI
jgi:tetratricopeptide (TPR) repeat protein